MASIQHHCDSARQEIKPSDIYGQEGPIRLHIATGGAGGTGLLKALAEAFISGHSGLSSAPFRIAWIATDTSLSFNALASGAADVSIVYHPYAIKLALQQGITTRTEYAWRDHFMLVGPKSNPAQLPITTDSTVQSLFSQVFLGAVRTSNLPSDQKVRFLSRYDKSANNIRESSIWTSIGQTPWSEPYSTWYHRYVDMPIGALRAANKLSEYTLVDRGTWYAVDQDVKERLQVYKESFDAAEDDPLINPAYVLLGARARDTALAAAFIDWLISDERGQKVIRSFAVNGTVLHSSAPHY